MTNKDLVLETLRKSGLLAAKAVQEKAADMTGTELNAVDDRIPRFVAAVAKMNMLERPVGFVCKSSAGRVVKLLQPYDSTVYTQEPEDLPAQWGFYWTTDPKKAKPFLLKWCQLSCKGGGIGSDAHRHQLGLFPADDILPRLRQRILPPRHIRRLDRKRIAKHQPVQLPDDTLVCRKARLAAAAGFRTGKQPLAQLRHARVTLDHPAFAALVIAERAVGAAVRAVFRLCAAGIQQIGRH